MNAPVGHLDYSHFLPEDNNKPLPPKGILKLLKELAREDDALDLKALPKKDGSHLEIEALRRYALLKNRLDLLRALES